MPDNVISFSYNDDFDLIRSSNSTATSFASRIPTTTEPTGDGVYDCHPGGVAQDAVLNYAMFVPFGRDTPGLTFDMRIFGWSLVAGSSTDVYIPIRLVQCSCTLGSATGVDGSNLEDEELICDTIASVTGSNLRTVVSPADNTIAHMIVDVTGFCKVEAIFDRTGATQANCLIRGF